MKKTFSKLMLYLFLVVTIIIPNVTLVNAAPSDWNIMLDYVEELETIAKNYIIDNNLSIHSRNLTIDYIRVGRYDSSTFNAVLGTPDASFVSYINTNYPHLETLKGYYDLLCPTSESIDVVHFFASLQGALQGELPGDLLGWGGDAASLAVELKSSGVSNANAPSEAINRFLSNSSSFGSTDWRSDLDGYNIAIILTSSGNENLSIADAIRQYYSSISTNPEQNRIDYFVKNRFNSIALNENAYQTTLKTTLDANAYIALYYFVNGNPNATLKKAVYDAVGSYLYSVMFSIYDFNFATYNSSMYVGYSQDITAIPAGTPLFAEYNWSSSSLTLVSLANQYTATTTVTALEEGTVVLSLTMGGQTKTVSLDITKKEIVVDNIKYTIEADKTAKVIAIMNGVETITIPSSISDNGETFNVSKVESSSLHSTNVKEVFIENPSINLANGSLTTGNTNELLIFVPTTSDVTSVLKDKLVAATTDTSNTTDFSIFAMDYFDIAINVTNTTHILPVSSSFNATVSSITYLALESYLSSTWSPSPSTTVTKSSFVSSWRFAGTEISNTNTLHVPSLTFTDDGDYSLTINGVDKGVQFAIKVVGYPTITLTKPHVTIEYGRTPFSKDELISLFAAKAEDYLGVAISNNSISVTGMESIRYSTPGDYSITFTVTDQNGLQNSVTAILSILSPKTSVNTGVTSTMTPWFLLLSGIVLILSAKFYAKRND